jgi:hypothetical protein
MFTAARRRLKLCFFPPACNNSATCFPVTAQTPSSIKGGACSRRARISVPSLPASPPTPSPTTQQHSTMVPSTSRPPSAIVISDDDEVDIRDHESIVSHQHAGGASPTSPIIVDDDDERIEIESTNSFGDKLKNRLLSPRKRAKIADEFVRYVPFIHRVEPLTKFMQHSLSYLVRR